MKSYFANPLRQARHAVQRLLVWSVIALFVLPLVLGLLGTLLPALGLMPGLADDNGFAHLAEHPQLFSAIWLTLKTGVIATVLVLVMTLITLVTLYETRVWRWVSALMPPLLAVPHAALAVGLVFLIAPSGALVRLISPHWSGWTRPPDAWLVPDTGGWSFVLGLVVKETPFLCVAAAAQLRGLGVSESLRMGRTLGYTPVRCWSRLVVPQLYPRIRLMVMIILAFNLTVVDMAVILAPLNPPTLPVLLMTLVNDPGSRAAASAGALLLAGLVLMAFVLIRVLEWVGSILARWYRSNGHRGRDIHCLTQGGRVLAGFVIGVSLISLVLIAVWSVVRRWRFPDTLPSRWGLDNWLSRGPVLMESMQTTVVLALCTGLLAMCAAVLLLEAERLRQLPRLDTLWLVPLLVPQVSVLFGWQAGAYWLGVDGHWLTVLYAHWLYALPYVMLILAVTWRELDPLWDGAGHVLGAGYWRVLLRVRLPLLMRPFCQAAAVAVAVSVAQYLPTLLLGAGRHSTLAIELVTGFGGVDRRVIAVLAVLQSLLPLLVFSVAIAYPYWRETRWQRLAYNEFKRQ